MKKGIIIVIWFVVRTSSAGAQLTTSQVTVQGEVLREGGGPWGELSVELHSLTHARPPERIPVMENGAFESRNVEPGEYDVRVFDSRGNLIHEELVRVKETGLWLAVRLPRREPASTGTSVVSVQRLLHPIPPKAEQEFMRAQDTSRAGDVNKSVQHLEKALRIYADYMEAHNNLGVAHMNLQQFEKAESDFRKAIALDSTCEKCQLNLGLALLAMRFYPDSESEIRKALDLAPGSIATHYALGQVLFAQNKQTEALESLRKASAQFPSAHLLVAHILLTRGEIPAAMTEFQKYLDSGRPEKRREVQAWLEALARSSKP